MVIGSVHVTDLDDHDLGDKTFELDPTTASDVATHFQVDHNSGKIIMLKGTPAGRHVLRVKVGVCCCVSCVSLKDFYRYQVLDTCILR